MTETHYANTGIDATDADGVACRYEPGDAVPESVLASAPWLIEQGHAAPLAPVVEIAEPEPEVVAPEPEAVETTTVTDAAPDAQGGE